MVATTQANTGKDTEKIPIKINSKLPHKVDVATLKGPVSPTGSTGSSVEDELEALRAKNKVLTEALASVRETALEEMKKRFDLVWFARYRNRYHNHEASKRIEKEYSDEIEKLRSDDGDFHHGFNSGLLAATRMFNEQADILHINAFDEMTKDFQNEAAKHTETIEKTKESFPNLEVSHNKFPEQTV